MFYGYSYGMFAVVDSFPINQTQRGIRLDGHLKRNFYMDMFFVLLGIFWQIYRRH